MNLEINWKKSILIQPYHKGLWENRRDDSKDMFIKKKRGDR